MFRPGSLMTASFAAIAFLTSAGTSPARAGDAPPRAAQLTLDDALRSAEAASPLVRRARAERNAVAAADVGASVLLPANPVIAGGVGPRREGPPANLVSERGLQYFVHAEQTVEVGGQRSARRK